MESILFNLENTPLIKIKDLTLDINSIKNLIKLETSNVNKNNKCLFNCISSFNKKISKISILDYFIDIHNEYDSSFKEVEILIDYYISELLYEGYSLRYLKDWYRKNFRNEVINNSNEEELKLSILKFKELSQNSKKQHEVKISINLPYTLKEYFEKNNEKKIDDIIYKILDCNEIPKDSKFKINKNSICLKAEVIACDEFKAIEIVINAIENYIEVYKVFDTSMGINPIIGCYTSHIIDLKETQEYIRTINYREKEDIYEFIELRENSDNKKTIKDIERVVNIVQKLSSDTLDNKLLNAWSALENILRFYDSKSIIGKIVDIIPKVIVMYSIKREMNNLWEMIFPLIEREKIKIDKLQECKSSKNLRKYDKEKFAVFLMKEETGSKLYEATKANVIINKNVVDLHEWLTNPKILLEKIEIDERAIKHNITTIYRLRNDLVHNGGIIDRNIQNKIDTLRYYINCILGTLIHHIKRNPELTMEEILNSILVTYDNYINNLKELKKKTDNIHKKIKENKYKNNDKDNSKKEEIKLIEELEKTIIEFGIENIAYTKYLYM